MAIGVVDESEFQSELERANNSPLPELRPAQVIDVNRGGRNEGDNNIPDALKHVIIDEKVEHGRSSAMQFAKMFDISSSSVSAATHGATSTASYNTPTKKLSDQLNKAKSRVANRARKVANIALDGLLEEGKLSDVKAIELAQIAKAMGGIIKDMEPPAANDGGNVFNGPSIIMYNPGFTKESNFETVEAGE